jgi:uncharacterized membrane protein
MISQTHIHLLITHLPIFGSLFGGLVLAFGIWRKNEDTIVASYALLIISAIGAVVAYVTGESAEETVEKIQGVSKQMIEEHSDFAAYALTALIFLGVSSVAGLIFSLKKAASSRKIAIFSILICAVSFGLIARTGYLGGQIRHTEINPSPANALQEGEKEDDD